MKTIILLVLFISFSEALPQAANYSFGYGSSAYSEITDGTLSTATGDDGGENISLPFVFVYNGLPYASARISTNGWLEMGTTYTGTGWLNDIASTFSKPLLCPLWDDLKRDASSTISYKTSGAAPNRVFTVQWKSTGWISVSYRVNFQVKLFEGTNVIKFCYGAMSSPASGSASIGINDEVGGAGHFISVTPAAVPTFSTQVANNSINSAVYLSTGLEYSFTPPVQPVKIRADQIKMNVPAGSVNQPVLRITVAQVSPEPSVTLTSLKFNLSSTTNKTDIDRAKVFYTGSNPVFSADQIYGSGINQPDTNFTVNGNISLPNGYHYFWIAFDIKANAPAGNFIDAGLTGADFTGMPSSVPDTAEPAGNRKITIGKSGLISVGTGADFINLRQALGNLETNGVSGPVTLEITSSFDTTNEQYPVYLRELPGISGVNNVTIKTANGINRVKLRTDSLAAIIIDGGRHFTVDGGINKNLLITNTSGQGHALLIRNGASYNTVTNCEFQGMNSSTTGGVIKFTDLIMSGNINNSINGCTIRSIENIFNTSNSLIYATGYSAAPSLGNSITNNEMINFHDNGIYLTGGFSNTLIRGNRIHFIPSNNFIPSAGSVHGIRIDNAPNTIIEGNYIYELWSQLLSTYTVRGIYMQGSFGVPMTTVVKNNYIGLALFFGLTSWGRFYGIDYYGYPENSIELYYNTILISGESDGFSGSAAVYKRYAADNFIMKNNIIISLRGSNNALSKYYAVLFENTAGNIVSDYNNIYANGNGSMLGNWNGIDLTDLNLWRGATGKDKSSVSKFVYFADTTGPHLNAPSIGDISLAGTPVAGIDKDIDGETRDRVRPYMGADENTLHPLPAELTSFSATVSGNSVLISFTTATETNVAGFEIERSPDGKNFIKIAALTSGGNSLSERKYHYTDASLNNRTYFYRIKTIDLDGSFKLSNEIEINIENPGKYSFRPNYPNPFGSESRPYTAVSFTVPEKSAVEISLFDSRGAKVKVIGSGEYAPGSYILRVDGSKFASGVYYLRMSAGNFEETHKAIILK